MAGPWEKYGKKAEAPSGAPVSKALEGPWQRYSGGVQPLPERQSQWDFPEEFASSLLLGFGPEVKAAANAVRSAGTGAFTGGTYGSPYEQALERYKNQRDAFMEREPFQGPATSVIGSLAPAGAVSNVAARAAGMIPRVGNFLAGGGGYGAYGEALPGWINRLARFGSQGSRGAIEGAAAGAATERLGGDATTGAVVGGPTGAVFGTGARAVQNWWRGAPASPARRATAQTMIDEGVELRGSQVARGGPFTPEQARQYTRAIARTFGASLDETEGLTEDVLRREADRIGAVFEDVAQSGVGVDDVMLTRLDDLEAAVGRTAIGKGKQNALRRQIQEIRDLSGAEFDPMNGTWSPGALDGDQFQSLTNYESALGRARRSKDPGVRALAEDIQDTLYSALERSAGPETLEDLARARMQWRNYLVAEDLASKPGVAVEGLDGVLDPRKVLPAAQRKHRQMASRGTPGSQMAPLARGGREFFTKQGSPWMDAPDWKTFATKEAFSGGIPAALGFAMHPSAGLPLGLAGMAVPAGAAGLRKLYHESPSYANALINRAPEAPRLNWGPRVAARLGGITAPGEDQIQPLADWYNYGYMPESLAAIRVPGLGQLGNFSPRMNYLLGQE